MDLRKNNIYQGHFSGFFAIIYLSNRSGAVAHHFNGSGGLLS
jgi:hypothetical protein